MLAVLFSHLAASIPSSMGSVLPSKFLVIFITATVCLSSLLLQAEENLAPLGLQENYIFVNTQTNYPIGKSLSFLRSGGYSHGIAYAHSLETNWMMAVGAKFMAFEDLASDERRFIASFHHETLRIIRIYYPAYLLIGAQTGYFLPTLTQTIPPKRDPLLEPEVGFGITAYLFSKISDRFAVYAKASRWRGTKTTKLQAFEMSIGIGQGI